MRPPLTLSLSRPLTLSLSKGAVLLIHRRPFTLSPSRPLTLRLSKGAVLLGSAIFLLGALFNATPAAHAQSPVTLVDHGVADRFPQDIVFSVSASGPSPIRKLSLHYKVLPDGTAAIGKPDFTPGTSVDATFTLEGNDPPKIYLPPGTTIEYHWEAADAAGNTATTGSQTFFYNDIRFQWQPVSDGGVTVYYYSGSEDNARQMLATATGQIARMSKLLGTRVGFPVKVWVYDSADDMRPALAARSKTFESQIITAGVRVSSDTVLVLGNVSFDTLRHELTHVVTNQAGNSPLGQLPVWLDEGTAVYGQQDPGGFHDAINRAIALGQVLSVRSISSYPGEPDKVETFYGEAWSLVKYLNDTYGADEFAQLFAQIKKGNRIGDALNTVYGFDQDGLEDRWREANGLPQRATFEPTASASPMQTIAAAQPEETGGGSGVTIVAVIAGTLAAAAVVGGGGFWLSRRLSR